MFKKWKEKNKELLDMYDTIIANKIAGNSVIEPTVQLNKSQIDLGFNSIASETQISKYFIVNNFPDWMMENIMGAMRGVIKSGVRINFFLYGRKHSIRWESAEMKSRIDIWKKYTSNISTTVNALDYRGKRDDMLNKMRIMESTKYLNEAELENKRSLLKVYMVIEISSKRDDTSLSNLIDSIDEFRKFCSYNDIAVKEIKLNMLDWLQTLGPFSLRGIKEITNKIKSRLMTDDVLANFNSLEQGRIGDSGIPLGIDVLSRLPVIKQFKEDPDMNECMLIAGTAGSGKSLFVKFLISWLLADGLMVTVLDYEGDEYTNFAAYIKAAEVKDALIISMGKGSQYYVEPLIIPDLCGDPDIDDELKTNCINQTLHYFRVMVAGPDEQLDKWQSGIISTAIKRVYQLKKVTEDKETWKRSKSLNITYVYMELCNMLESQEFVDESLDNLKHIKLMEIVEYCKVFFEKGEARYGTFLKPLSLDELTDAKLVVFSFGMSGSIGSQIDYTMLALRQLSVANISIQISNHCKYVKNTFNVKVWEEYNRWGDVKGSSEIIVNAMTGGRKRGDINLLITNNLASLLDDTNMISAGIAQNISSFAIGKITSSTVIKKFCEKFSLQNIEWALRRISKSSSKKKGANGARNDTKYTHAFCVVLEDNRKAIVKVMLPKNLTDSTLFKSGVDKKKEEI